VKRRRWLALAVLAVAALTMGSACNAVLGIDKLDLQSLDASLSGLDDGSSNEDSGTTDATVDGRESGRSESGGDDRADVLESGIVEGGGDVRASSIESGLGDGGGDDQAAGLESGSVEGGGEDADSASCASGQACTPDTACQIGLTACDGGLQRCIATSSAKDGTQCDDAGSVCSSGACAACKAGLDCSEAGSCQRMQISCAMGPQCTAQGNQPNGSSCGPNLYCNGGTCAPCTNGASCVPTLSPCHKGTVSCMGGAITCSDTMANDDDGTPCGTNHVCKAGACVACTSGASCTPNGNVCQTGTTSCATGQQTCAPAGNVTNGTVCDDGNACTQTDSCQSGTCTGSNPIVCAASDQCHTAGICDTSTGKCSNPAATNGFTCDDGNACTQTDSCQSGTCTGSNPIVCSASDQCHTAGNCDTSTGKCSNPAATNSTPCNTGDPCMTGDKCTNGVCSGTQIACPPLDQCHTAGTCSAGACGGYPNIMNGTPCGTSGHYCYNGNCEACASGNSCSPNGNICLTGVTSCSTGQQTCTQTGDNNGVSCAGGSCCGGTCLNTTNDNNACGTSCRTCPSGTNCENSACTVRYGLYTPFAPCGNTVTYINANLLVAEQLSVSTTITVTALGMIGHQPASGVQGFMVLYADSGGSPGAPTTLKTYTNGATIVDGANELPVFTATTLSPGSYWIAAEFATNAAICDDNSTSNNVNYVNVTYPMLPNPFGTPTKMGSANFNFYIVGTE
jgi:hypothetical protein